MDFIETASSASLPPEAGKPFGIPNRADMERHLLACFGQVPPNYQDGLIELAWSSAREKKLTNARLFGLDQTQELLDFACQINAVEGQSAYIGPALRSRSTQRNRRTSQADFLVTMTATVDIDEDRVDAALELCRRLGLGPHAIVQTGTKPWLRAHLIWSHGTPIDDWAAGKAMQAALASAFGGDPLPTYPSSLMRLGGSIAWPKKPGRETELTVFREIAPSLPIDAKLLMSRISTIRPPATVRDKPSVSREMQSKPLENGHRPPPGVRVNPDEGEKAAQIWGPAVGWVDDLKSGGLWYPNALKIVGHWIAMGWSDDEILAEAEGLTMDTYTTEQTRAEIAKMIPGGRVKWDKPDPAVNDEAISSSPQPDTNWPCFHQIPDPCSIPARAWLLGTSHLRRQVTLLIAPPGAAKSTLTLSRGVALATGRPITGEAVRQRVRVWIHNNEDDQDELNRRLAAILRQHNIPADELTGWLVLTSGADRPLVFARPAANGSIMRLPDVDLCIDFIRNHDIGWFSIDPFAESHEVNENSNEEIKAVAVLFRQVAWQGNCSVSLVHHTAKPPQGAGDSHAGNMNSARGASSLVGVARVVQTLYSMTATDAEVLGIQESERRRYVRLDDAKANLSLASDASTWFQKVSVALPNGDQVGALVHHEFGTRAEAENQQLRRTILKQIDTAWQSGQPFGQRQNNRRPVYPMMIKAGCTMRSAKKMVEEWITEGVVITEVCETKNKTSGLRVTKTDLLDP